MLLLLFPFKSEYIVKDYVCIVLTRKAYVHFVVPHVLLICVNVIVHTTLLYSGVLWDIVNLCQKW